VVRKRGKKGGEDQRVKIDRESFSAGEAGREGGLEEVGWVERKQLVKTELLLNGGRAWGARDGGGKGRQRHSIERYL